ncbi:MAG TPA: DUF3488 and transglutaminase-like domain-containing protein [Pyrinomonadaceae bacterium]|jgi:transglutaminase-like putative cysteine protease|nr:DUF3488 and transglutaminase-like domain-containing protein [Pyrinomonadaceae bacterium]
MNFDRIFRTLSYAAVFCGFFSLWVTGTFGFVGSAVFLGIMIAAWFLEGSQWQISERLGTALIVLALPVYYFAWKLGFLNFASSETLLAGILARLILSLTLIKLLQKKGDRDWIFLYMMAFFEVLLAAGLSISAMYFFSFVLYAFVMVCTIIVFEVKKTESQTRAAASFKDHQTPHLGELKARSVPLTAITLLILIAVFATPMFFLLPRVGGAGLVGNNNSGLHTYSGFSDHVHLGDIGTIQQSDEVVMRVKLDGTDRERLAGRIKWRGVVLDTFTGKEWSKTRTNKEPQPKVDDDLIQVDFRKSRESLTTQTIYLEPLDSAVLFNLPRAVAVRSNFPIIFKDGYGSLSTQSRGERVSYTVLSDTVLPTETELRIDRERYSSDDGNYLQLPEPLDPRIAQLATRITANSFNRYDKAKAIEQYLQTQLGYTLEMKAGGEDPLADFLFNVREGHCEYFATAMAIMLRTQGIATRIVNGFQQGSYNETADVLVVRQRNAHSWVEVYFPGEKTWVPFDPTPFGGQNSTGSSFGITDRFNKYLEALETFWIQYFVAFDNQEQRSMFSSIKKSVRDYGTKTSAWTDAIQERIARWMSDLSGDQGAQARVRAIGYGSLYLAGILTSLSLFVWLYRKVVKLEVWRRLWDRLFAKRHASIVEFYDRMLIVLAGKGFEREPHQTPLEFAFALGIPEAVKITEKYNRVRFGRKKYLTRRESAEIEEWLEEISAKDD